MPSEATPEGVVSNEVTSSVPTEKPALAPAPTADTASKATPSNDDEIPNEELPQRLRGTKSFKDAVSKYREIESELGRKNNEVGQLRYVIDSMLNLKRTEDLGATATPKHTPVNTDSLLADPEAAISNVARRTVTEATSQVSDRLARMEYDIAREKFGVKHPGYEATMEQPAFIDWIKASPYRMRLAEHATKGSFEAADELFGLHAELAAAKAAATPKVDPKAVAAASLTRPGNGNTTGGAAKSKQPSAAGAEIYSRIELGKLYANDREKYNSMMPEIMAAYKEGRVR